MDSTDPAGEASPLRSLLRNSGAPLRPLSVLVVGVTWPMETFVERLITGLASRRMDLTIVSPVRPTLQWLDRHQIAWEFGPQPFDVREAIRQARRDGLRSAVSTTSASLRNRSRRDVVAGGLSRPTRFDVIYAPWISILTEHETLLEADIPVVTSCRGAQITIAPWDPRRHAHSAALPRVFDAARLVHCVSDRIVQDAVALGLDPDKARVIRPAVDPDRYTPRGPHGALPMRAIGVGSLNWRKDHEHALLALRKALDLGADLRLDLIGGGPERQHLLYAIDDLGLTSRTRLLGHRSADEVAEELRAADVFLHTSSSEGISNAVLEGMATGLPVVTTEAGGMREAVREGVEGFVVGIRDADATAVALAKLAADPALRVRMGVSARARIVSDFRLDEQVTAFQALLYEAAGR